MLYVRPTTVLADDIDELLILRALFEGLIGLVGLALDVVDKFADKISPIAFCIAFDVRNICGNVRRDFNLFPSLVAAKEI